MAQKPQIVDLNKSYLVTDPNAFLENMVATEREDGEEAAFPILPYEGYNFLPTDYGYRSYFGQNSSLGALPLTSRVQFILNWQAPNLHEWLIALAEDGIWAVDTNVGGAWLHLVTHTFDVDEFEQWTFCTIENVMYFYKQGNGVVYHTSHNLTTFDLEIASLTPNFLNMAGQIGIFKAGTRLGFWDSLNSVSWSSTFDFEDFTPSLETLAGNMLLNEVLGHIVGIRDSGEGFIVYATGSIVGVYMSSTTDILWDAKRILEVGVVNPRSISYGKDTKEHWAWTTAGILKLGHYVPLSGKFEYEFIFPEVYDFFREARNPVYIDCIQNRFVIFRVFDDGYLYGYSSSSASYVDPTRTALILADGYWDGDIEVLPSILDGNTLRTIFEQWAQDNSPTTMTDSLGCI